VTKGLKLTLLNDRFEVDRGTMLGDGTYGRVCKGYDKEYNKLIAVKHVSRHTYMNYKVKTDTIREMNIMQRLKHPNII
jgi:serine/threonine protein kinase